VRPLEGVRIADLTWLLAGAGGPRILASLGAEVIRVEWRERLDFLRYMPPFMPEKGEGPPKGGALELAGLDKQKMRSVNRAGYFNDINSGKKGIGLNMKHPKGRELFKRLVAISDVVVESFTAPTMRKWGLAYEDLQQVKSDIIYVQQPGWGYKGPYVDFVSYGPTAQAISGLTEQSGLPSPRPPAGWGFSYMDWSGAYYCAMSMLLAIYYKKRTGKGQYIDCSQVEPAIYMTGTAILDYLVNQSHYQRTGNRSPYKPAAPHGAYCCAGEDRWIALAAFTEEEWRGLVGEMGNPSWAQNGQFGTLDDRLRNQDELDRLIGEWTKGQEPYTLMQRLQKAGVPAGVCQTAQDRVDADPQLSHFSWLLPLPHSEAGTWPVKDVPFKFSDSTVTQGGMTGRASPCYAEDNDYVYGELLKLTKEERTELEEEGVI
jgi:crotonobetainyl-CoA:carnitine CoA-transferase CaiB-like acyl-CoA transferase